MGTSNSNRDCETIPRLSNHAGSRMATRHISQDDVATVMSYGRTYYVRGAVIYALGRREAEDCRKDGLHPERIEGLQVVCASESNTVITVYRNNDFSSLKRRNNRWSPLNAG
ncbi:MAG: DUF4258 domain-containing protein [Desulfuromonadaceae bacterium]|nr:DUF4258 domain-containing protein [Desulfuromonadaceae bacterium]MDD2854465.1 DUF4258 domain-containing protein [Desulfuromonadaceae bacterium]